MTWPELQLKHKNLSPGQSSLSYLFIPTSYATFGVILHLSMHLIWGNVVCAVYAHVYMMACAFGWQSSTANILLNCAPTNFWRQDLSLNLDLTNSARLASQRLLGSACLCMPSIGITVLQYHALLFSKSCRFTSFSRRQFPGHLV